MSEDRWKHNKGRDDGIPNVPGAPFTVPDGFLESDDCRKFLGLLPEYVFFESAPKILAANARAKGAAHLSSRDFECPCPVDTEDALPRCLGARDECRFSGRPGDPNAPLSDETHNARGAAAAQAMAEEMGAFFQADEAGRRRINQRLSQAAARRRRRAEQAGSLALQAAIEGPTELEPPATT